MRYANYFIILSLINFIEFRIWCMNNDVLSSSSFCEISKYAYRGRMFPVDPPEHHLPWLWDALVDPVRKIVEITTMNRVSCKFSKSYWNKLRQTFPEYDNKLAYGLESNILVPVDGHVNDNDNEDRLLHYRVVCQFLDNDENIIFSSNSFKIRGKSPFTTLGTLQIRCPYIGNNEIFQRVRICINDAMMSSIVNVFNNCTVSVPVCRISNYPQPSNQRQFNLSICSATRRTNRSHLVEWIEYYRLIGVNHFYIYDTNTENPRILSETLSDYIMDGIVSVIPWHFMNCVRNMANGRMAIWFQNDTKYFFQSPRAIAHTSALGSCYSRFRHTSKYILHVDDDEFLTYSVQSVQSRFKSGLIQKVNNLVELSDILFKIRPKTIALRFEPILFFPCSIVPGRESIERNNCIDYSYDSKYSSDMINLTTPLPRLGVWDVSEPSDAKYEAKLLMRTDAVGMFFVHYISLIELGPYYRHDDKFYQTYSLSELAMLHYKYPASLSHNILEEHLPIHSDSFKGLCRFVYDLDNNRNKYYAQIPYEIISRLKTSYLKRMESYRP